MKRRKGQKYTELLERIAAQFRGFVLAALVTVFVLGVVVGYRYYRYTEEDPRFCASCHLMDAAMKEWQKGKHRDVVCQQCHKLTIFEKNQLLVAFVVAGSKPLAQTHGREKPWLACKQCHMESAGQGSVTMKKSYGHARHVFMNGVACNGCHKGTIHDFHPNEASCQGCHKDKGVHGIGMEAFSCLKCHSFSEKTPSMIPQDRCIRCHKAVPQKGPMAGLPCHQCHKPHGTINPTSTTCVKECHRNETAVGQHGSHLKAGLDCLYCHKQHFWVVGQERAKTLCSTCHVYRKPESFIF